MRMRFLHTMLRVQNLERALSFFVDQLGLREVGRSESVQGRFTLVFLSTGADGDGAQVELTYNWDQTQAYATCANLEAKGVDILRPPRDGRMAFIKSPDGHSIELLQASGALPPEEPWKSRANQGDW
jgi:lactoylglutathione lyase